MSEQLQLDQDEKRLVDAYRRARQNEYGEITAKIHHKKLVAIETTEKWHVGRLNENGQ